MAAITSSIFSGILAVAKGAATAAGSIGAAGGAGAAGGTAGVLGTAYTGGQVATGVMTAASVASAGYSVYSGVQQSQAQSAAAKYNAAVQQNNAIRQRYQVEQQAIQDLAIAQNQVAWQNYNAQIQKNNAISIRNSAIAEEKAARENVRRARKEKQRRLSSITATSAARGLDVGEGTVVESLAETSGILELDILEISRQAQISMNEMFYQAELEEAGVQRTLAEAGITQFRADNAAYNYGTGRQIEQFGREQARMTLLSGQTEARDSLYRGVASGISGASGAYWQNQRFKDVGVSGTKRKSNSYFGSGNLTR